MTAVDDLIAFLRARLDEREDRAHAWERLEQPRIDHDPGECDDCDRARRRIANAIEHSDFDEPEFVLAEVDAKRRIIEMEPPDHFDDPRWNGFTEGHEQMLRLLALPYADHPDYRAEWRP